MDFLSPKQAEALFKFRTPRLGREGVDKVAMNEALEVDEATHFLSYLKLDNLSEIVLNKLFHNHPKK